MQQRICLQCRRPRFNSWVGKIPWRREWQPTSIFLPGEFHGQRSLVSPWGRKDLDTTQQRTLLLYICIHIHIHDSLGLKFSCSFFSSFCFFRKYWMILLNHFLFIWILLNHAFYIENGFVFLLYLDEPKLCFWKRTLTYIKGLFDILGGKYTWNYKLPSWKIFRIVLKLPQILDFPLKLQ